VGFFDRVLGRAQTRVAERPQQPGVGGEVLGGHETLEVVGESFHQDDLWQLAGGFTRYRVRCECVAALVPEPENPYDANAIKVLIGHRQVGHLSREDAVIYLPGVRHLLASRGTVSLRGQIVGGGKAEGRLGMLGVFLDHNPADFGLRVHEVAHIGELQTGLSQAIGTDLEDDSYDLSWLDQLSGTHSPADVVVLRRLLLTEEEPIDRHYMFAELEKCLYKCRDAFASALEDFDAICRQHDAEMATIKPALYDKFGAVPVIDTYRQAAIRWQKARSWDQVHTWAVRGLAVYGDGAARMGAVEDLHKRLAYAESKLAAASRAYPASQTSSAARASSSSVSAAETLVCSNCGTSFERIKTRGRKPSRCPSCRPT
jgi:rubrerythrin